MGKNAMLAQQKEEIAIQKEKLSHTNRQMRESITYAQRIQRTVISSQEEMDAVFPQNFVLYRPRDIVSGDFYRIYAIRGHKIIVVADCTGHGVPGALLSMMGISALKDIFGQLEITGGDIEPAAILQQLRNFVRIASRRRDIGLCRCQSKRHNRTRRRSHKAQRRLHAHRILRQRKRFHHTSDESVGGRHALPIFRRHTRPARRPRRTFLPTAYKTSSAAPTTANFPSKGSPTASPPSAAQTSKNRCTKSNATSNSGWATPHSSTTSHY